MKTTVDIPDSLLEEAKKLAASERTTVRALFEEGLRRAIRERKRTQSFRLRKVTYKGKGLQPDFADASWDRIRQGIYQGRGE